MNKLINHLPLYERKSKIYRELFNSYWLEIGDLEIGLEELEKQFFIDTATWALKLYERELGIITDTSKSYRERREVIKSKLIGAGKLDAEGIKRVVDAFTNGGVDVDFNRRGEIVITFNDVYGVPPNMEDVYKSIENVSPAHLALKYIFMYLYIKDIHEKMTLEKMENTKLDKFAF